MKNIKIINIYILLIIIILIFFYLINIFLKKTNIENYIGLQNKYFFDSLKKHNYKIDNIKKTITHCVNDNNISSSCKTKSYEKHFNTIDSIKLAKNKDATSTLLMKNNIPVPNFMIVSIYDNPQEIYKKMHQILITFPIVLKPINGTFGIDVFTNIDDINTLTTTLQYFKDSKKMYKHVLLEEQIDGDCYRIFIFNNKVIDIIKREKPFVIGNGINTLGDLIEDRNEQQKKDGFFITKNISTLYLKKQGYTLDVIPKNGEKIFITDIINMHNGARISRIPLEKIPQKNIDLFLKVNKVMDITCSGLDYLSNDITVEYDKNNSRILEVNGTPDTEIHHKIDFNNGEDDFYERISSNIF
jgi:glutathione synthase/RimK-type ligase-like ATP-grasp enzyme